MKVKNIIWGLFFIAAGAVVILNQTGFMGEIGIWTLIIALALVPVIVNSVIHTSFSGILFPIAIYAILFAEPLGIEKFTPWPVLGAALFLFIGLSLIFPKKHKHHFDNKDWEKHFDHKDWKNQFQNQDYIDIEENYSEDANMNGEHIWVRSRFNGTVKYITSQNLKTLDIDASFAGIKIYLDNANLSDGQAAINVYASFGGVEIYVPKEWKVINDVSCTFAGSEDKGLKGYDNGENTLILKGVVKFSGISIIRV